MRREIYHDAQFTFFECRADHVGVGSLLGPWRGAAAWRGGSQGAPSFCSVATSLLGSQRFSGVVLPPHHRASSKFWPCTNLRFYIAVIYRSQTVLWYCQEMQLDDFLSRPDTHRHAAHEYFFTCNFSDFSLASHSLNEEKIMEELFRRDDDGSCLVELDNFVTEMRRAQAGFQAVLGGATDDDFGEPRVDGSGASTATRDKGENPVLMILFIIMLVVIIMVSFTKTPCILDALRFF